MIQYLWSGKFEAKSDKWVHITRKLKEYELMMVEKGTLYIGNENESFEVQENEYLIMTPCENQHGTKAGNCSFHWLHFQSEEESLPCSLHGTIGNWNQLLSILNLLFKCEQQNHREVSNRMTEALLYELSYAQKEEQKPKRIKQIIDDYLIWNPEGNLRIMDIAYQLGYNEKYLSRLFYRETGQQLKRYLLEHNLEKAKSMLLNSHCSIEQIAICCGYSDAHNFTRMIRTELGMSPSEFRQRFEQK